MGHVNNQKKLKFSHKTYLYTVAYCVEMTYFCLSLFQCTFLPEVGIGLETIFSLAACKSQSVIWN